MKQIFIIIGSGLFFLSFITGCPTTKVAPKAVSLKVEFTWTSAHKCTTVSPEIRVAGIPSPTKKLKVSLEDLNVTSFNHGGGTIKYEGSDFIPAGSLKEYVGPCPPDDSQHTYQIQVEAIDASDVIVGSGKKTLVCCP